MDGYGAVAGGRGSGGRARPRRWTRTRRAEEARGGEEEGDNDEEDDVKEEDGGDDNEGVGPAEPARRRNWQSEEDEESTTRRWWAGRGGGDGRGGGLNVVHPVRRHDGRGLRDTAIDGNNQQFKITITARRGRTEKQMNKTKYRHEKHSAIVNVY